MQRELRDRPREAVPGSPRGRAERVPDPRDLDLAERALEELRRLGAADAGDYVIVADMHAKAKNWAAAAAFRTEADASLGWSPHTPPRCR